MFIKVMLIEELSIEYKNSIKEKLRYATLRSEVLIDFGLNGKLGMAILFYEYSRLYQDILYEQLADDLVNAILVLPDSLSLDMNVGLSGIAWGLIYLYQHEYIYGDIQEIVYDIDKRLIKKIEDVPKDVLSYFSFRKECLGDNISSLSELENEIISSLLVKYEDALYTKNDVLNIIWNNWM